MLTYQFLSRQIDRKLLSIPCSYSCWPNVRFADDMCCGTTEVARNTVSDVDPCYVPHAVHVSTKRFFFEKII